jgi:hypothetical protein
LGAHGGQDKWRITQLRNFGGREQAVQKLGRDDEKRKKKRVEEKKNLTEDKGSNIWPRGKMLGRFRSYR